MGAFIAPNNLCAAVFVGGPIQYALNSRGSVFDTKLRTLIESVIHEIEALGCTVLSAHRVERFGVLTPNLSPQEVAERDFKWIRECSLFVPILPLDEEGKPYRTDGTNIEIGWASALSKPVLLLTDGNPPGESYSHLIRGLSALGRIECFDLHDLTPRGEAFRDLVMSLLDLRPA